MASFRCANPDCNDLLAPVADEHGRLDPMHFRCTNPSCRKPTDLVVQTRRRPSSALVQPADPRRQERGL